MTAEIVETSVKDAWGVSLAGTSSERYSGIAQREVDTESGLTFMRHRMYDPKLGRFTQGEPILERRPSDHYSYGGNNPVSFTDPTGEVISIPKAMEEQFDALLKTNGIGGSKKTDAGLNICYSGAPDTLTHPAAYSLNSEIFFRMISSERWFTFNTTSDIQMELTLRKNIIAAANAAKWQFTMQADKIAPKGLEWTNGKFRGNPSDVIEAWFGAGATECQASCNNFNLLVLLKGLKDTINTPGADGKTVDRFSPFFTSISDPIQNSYTLSNMVNKAKRRNTSGKLKGQVETSTSKYDWIPGDAGFLAPDRGDVGYNILYVGGSYKTGDALLAEPKSFYGGVSGEPASYNDWANKLPNGSLAPWRLGIDVGLFHKE